RHLTTEPSAPLTPTSLGHSPFRFPGNPTFIPLSARLVPLLLSPMRAPPVLMPNETSAFSNPLLSSSLSAMEASSSTPQSMSGKALSLLAPMGEGGIDLGSILGCIGYTEAIVWNIHRDPLGWCGNGRDYGVIGQICAFCIILMTSPFTILRQRGVDLMGSLLGSVIVAGREEKTVNWDAEDGEECDETMDTVEERDEDPEWFVEVLPSSHIHVKSKLCLLSMLRSVLPQLPFHTSPSLSSSVSSSTRFFSLLSSACPYLPRFIVRGIRRWLYLLPTDHRASVLCVIVSMMQSCSEIWIGKADHEEKLVESSVFVQRLKSGKVVVCDETDEDARRVAFKPSHVLTHGMFEDAILITRQCQSAHPPQPLPRYPLPIGFPPELMHPLGEMWRVFVDSRSSIATCIVDKLHTILTVMHSTSPATEHQDSSSKTSPPGKNDAADSGSKTSNASNDSTMLSDTHGEFYNDSIIDEVYNDVFDSVLLSISGMVPEKDELSLDVSGQEETQREQYRAKIICILKKSLATVCVFALKSCLSRPLGIENSKSFSTSDEKKYSDKMHIEMVKEVIDCLCSELRDPLASDEEEEEEEEEREMTGSDSIEDYSDKEDDSKEDAMKTSKKFLFSNRATPSEKASIVLLTEVCRTHGDLFGPNLPILLMNVVILFDRDMLLNIIVNLLCTVADTQGRKSLCVYEEADKHPDGTEIRTGRNYLGSILLDIASKLKTKYRAGNQEFSTILDARKWTSFSAANPIPGDSFASQSFCAPSSLRVLEAICDCNGTSSVNESVVDATKNSLFALIAKAERECDERITVALKQGARFSEILGNPEYQPKLPPHIDIEEVSEGLLHLAELKHLIGIAIRLLEPICSGISSLMGELSSAWAKRVSDDSSSFSPFASMCICRSLSVFTGSKARSTVDRVERLVDVWISTWEKGNKGGCIANASCAGARHHDSNRLAEDSEDSNTLCVCGKALCREVSNLPKLSHKSLRRLVSVLVPLMDHPSIAAQVLFARVVSCIVGIDKSVMCVHKGEIPRVKKDDGLLSSHLEETLEEAELKSPESLEHSSADDTASEHSVAVDMIYEILLDEMTKNKIDREIEKESALVPKALEEAVEEEEEEEEEEEMEKLKTPDLHIPPLSIVTPLSPDIFPPEIHSLSKLFCAFADISLPAPMPLVIFSQIASLPTASFTLKVCFACLGLIEAAVLSDKPKFGIVPCAFSCQYLVDTLYSLFSHVFDGLSTDGPRWTVFKEDLFQKLRNPPVDPLDTMSYCESLSSLGSVIRVICVSEDIHISRIVQDFVAGIGLFVPSRRVPALYLLEGLAQGDHALSKICLDMCGVLACTAEEGIGGVARSILAEQTSSTINALFTGAKLFSASKGFRRGNYISKLDVGNFWSEVVCSKKQLIFAIVPGEESK
ncbi:hypothetical protein ADUPG1_013220, partial [Aduncisulcus paluster]